MSTEINGIHVAVIELEKLYQRLQRPLTIVETGCLRSEEPRYRKGDGYSTLHIAEWIRRSGIGHSFYTIDYLEENLLACNRVLTKGAVRQYATLVHGDSAKILESFPDDIDFAFLDANQFPEQTLREFRAVENRGVKVVVIDDVYNRGTVNKGSLAIPVAREWGWKIEKAADRMAVLTRGEQ